MSTQRPPSSQVDLPSRRKLPTTRMASTTRTIMKISKFNPRSLSRHQPTITARGAFNKTVWMDGPRQWKSAKLIWLSLHVSVSRLLWLLTGWIMYLPGFVNGCQMLCGLLDQRNQDKTHETIRHASLLDNVFDLLDQENGRHTDAGQ